MTAPGYEKSASCITDLGGSRDAEDAQTTTHKGAEAMSQDISLPARFHQVHEGDNALYVANQYRGPSFYAEEVILPNSDNGLEPVLNLELSIEEGSANDVRKALEDALTWFHHVESQLPGGTEVNR